MPRQRPMTWPQDPKTPQDAASASGGCPHRRPFIAPCWSFKPRVQDRSHGWWTRTTGGRRLGRLHRQRSCSRRPQPSVKRLGSKDEEPQKPQSRSRAKAAGGRYRTPADLRSDLGSCKAKKLARAGCFQAPASKPSRCSTPDAEKMAILVLKTSAGSRAGTQPHFIYSEW